MSKFLQIELWKQCRNNCKFCFNIGMSDIDKEYSIKYVLDNIEQLMSRKNYDRLGLIGGEFFDNQLEDPIIFGEFYELIDKILIKLEKNELKQFLITSSLIFGDKKYLDALLLRAKTRGVDKKLMICTSYDQKYRFNSENSFELWKNNMNFIHKSYPNVAVHTEMIVTEDLVDAILDNKFSLNDFMNNYHTKIDFLEPNTGCSNLKKPELEKKIPGFFPRRDRFLKFVMEVCVKTHIIDIRDLLSRDTRSDDLLLSKDGKFYMIENRHGCTDKMQCESIGILRDFGYIDSDIDMRSDVMKIQESIS